MQHQNRPQTLVRRLASSTSLRSSAIAVSPRSGLPTRWVAAALFTSVVSLPNSSTAVEIARTTSSSSSRSVWTNRARPPRAWISASTRRPSGSLRPAISTFAPSLAKRWAIPRPMPRVAPVTSATFPSSRMAASAAAQPSADSMASTSSAAWGSVGGAKRAATRPSRSTTNLAKFHLMSPDPSGSVDWAVSQA